jgi:hypothetical protein
LESGGVRKEKHLLMDLDSQTNRYSYRFTVIVIGIALAALAGWWLTGQAGRGLKAFISVLIVACPCALALAAPFTLGTAQRWLARACVFLKNGLVLERMARVNAIVFDKTGTLTAAGVGQCDLDGFIARRDPGALPRGDGETLPAFGRNTRGQRLAELAAALKLSDNCRRLAPGERVRVRANH